MDQEIDIEADSDQEFELSWAPYPRAESYAGMHSVNFSNRRTFVGVTEESVVIIDEVGRRVGQNMVQVAIDAGCHVLGRDGEFQLWTKRGCHVFGLEQELYVCCLLRSSRD